MQRLFIALATQKGLCMYGGNARDVYVHAPAPEMMTHLTIDDAYFEWFKEKTEKILNCWHVLPVLHSLQGHPESGNLWMKLIDQINSYQGIRIQDNYQGPLHLYKEDWRTYPVVTLSSWQLLLCVCTVEQDAKNIYNLIGTKIQFQSEREKGDIPFEYLGSV